MKYNFVALCAVGVESIVSNELKKNNFIPYDRKAGRVFFSSDESLYSALFRANFLLRCVDRIFLLLEKQKTKDFDSFFSIIKEVEWEAFFNKNCKIILDKVSSFHSKLASEHALQSMAYKAICTRLMDKWKMHSLPEKGREARVRLYLEEDELFVCLDTSGQPLYKRGYRLSGGEAPLRESVASNLLHFMQWKRKYPLHDAFSGSGTISTEALYYALNIPPGIDREFAFENFECFREDKLKWEKEKIKESAIKEIRTDCTFRITASDIAKDAVFLTQANIERACILAGRIMSSYGMSSHIVRPEVFASDFNELVPPYENGVLLSNPPYGVRLLEEESVRQLYKDIAKRVRLFEGWKLGFITNTEEFATLCQRENKHATIKKHAIKTGNMQMYLYVIEEEKR